MKSPMLYAIRQLVIEGRRHTQGQKGKPIRIPTLGIRGRLLEHPSTPFHYVAVKAVTSGAWRSQKKLEVVKLRGQQIWECCVYERVRRRLPRAWRGELTGFLDTVFGEQIDQIWLDTDFEFESRQWPGWSFVYQSTGSFEQYSGEGTTFRQSIPIYTGVCSAGIAHD